jgi:hypothetical protein
MKSCVLTLGLRVKRIVRCTGGYGRIVSFMLSLPRLPDASAGQLIVLVRRSLWRRWIEAPPAVTLGHSLLGSGTV